MQKQTIRNKNKATMTNVFSKHDLRYLQSLPLRLKVQKTQAKILEWCLYWDWKVYVSFSGGKDSTVLFDLVTRVAAGFGKEVPGVFCDTGIEYPEIRAFVKSFGNNVTWVRPEKSFKAIIDEHGFPVVSKEVSFLIENFRADKNFAKCRLNSLKTDGSPNRYAETRFARWRHLVDAPFKISDRCCHYLKKRPFNVYERKTGRKAITAMMADESKWRENGYLRTGCNNFESRRPVCNPMGFWVEQDVLQYILDFNVRYCSVYGDIAGVSQPSFEIIGSCGERNLYCTGRQRTGCVFCMYGAHLDKEPNRFQRLRESHPKLYRYCMDTLGCKKVLEYLNVVH